jgi:hypothetical protein
MTASRDDKDVVYGDSRSASRKVSCGRYGPGAFRAIAPAGTAESDLRGSRESVLFQATSLLPSRCGIAGDSDSRSREGSGWRRTSVMTFSLTCGGSFCHEATSSRRTKSVQAVCRHGGRASTQVPCCVEACGFWDAGAVPAASTFCVVTCCIEMTCVHRGRG